MGYKRTVSRGHVVSALLGVFAGALLLAIATKAIPKIMSQTMAGMMQNMMAQMREAGRDPTAI